MKNVARGLFLRSCFPLGVLVISFALSGCAEDDTSAADRVNEIDLSRTLNTLSRDEATALCAEQYRIFNGEGGTLQCKGVTRPNHLGTMEECVTKLDDTTCERSVKSYRLCHEPSGDQDVCTFAPASGCADLVFKCKLARPKTGSDTED